MSQQINLFEGGLVKSRDWFSLPIVTGIYVLAAVVMFYLFTGLEAENADLQTQRNQAVAQYESMQKKVDAFAQHVTPIDNSKLEAELKDLKGRFEMQSQILAIFQQSISDKAHQLVDYMRALTAQQQPGLWLTGFRIEPAAQHVTLSGQALHSEDIPSYLDLLSAQPVFEGTQFAGIQFKQTELHRPQVATVVPPPSATPAAISAPETPTGKDAGAATGNTSAAPVATTPPVAVAVASVPLQVYSFEVKGQDLQNKVKRESTASWDEFVRQTTQSSAKQP